MRVVAAERNIESTFKGKKNKFRIEASAKAFQILSSNLYTDKPLAILRELSCNARDAHRDAGTLDIPFEIDMPNRLNPTLRIRDFGTGMTKEKVNDLYSTVFASDKTNNNDDIGGLGLGSKTPFSYSDTFTLITYLKGRKTIWLCYIDDDGEPAIQEAENSITDEHDGVEYQIPIKFEDFNAFKEKLPRALAYFPPEAYKTSVPIPEIKYKMKNDLYGLRERGSVTGPLVLMGPVAYRLDKSAFDREDQNRYSIILDHDVDIFCEIGDIDFQASREALSYDSKSKKAILTILQHVTATLMSDIQDKIKSCATYIDACIKARELMKNFHYSHREGMKWKGKNVFDDPSFNFQNEVSMVYAGDITSNNQLRPKFSRHLYLTLDSILKEPVFIHFDVTCPLNSVRIKHYLQEEANGKPLLLFKDETDMLAVMTHYELFDSISTFDMEVPEKLKNDAGKITTKVPVKIKVIKSSCFSFCETSMSIDEINNTENACWAPLFGAGSDPWAKAIHKALHRLACQNLNISATVFGVPKSLQYKAKQFTIPPIEEFLRGKIIETLDLDTVLLGTTQRVYNLDWHDKLYLNFPVQHQHLELYTELAKHNSKGLKVFMNCKEQLESLLGWKFEVFDGDTSPCKLYTLLTSKYSLLRHVDSMFYSSSGAFISDALNLIHGDKK